MSAAPNVPVRFTRHCVEQYQLRFRPALDITEPELEFGLAALDRTLTTLAR